MPITQAESSIDTLATEPLYVVAYILLGQVIDLLKTTITRNEQLSFTSKLIPGSTPGKHLRHIHDHYRLLLDALPASPASQSPLSLSYDTRARNLASETSHSAALDSFVSLQTRLQVETGGGKLLDGKAKVLLDAVTPIPVQVETTVARELWFTSLHATHHFALLRVIACGELGLTVPEEFGVAPSTLVSREGESASIHHAVDQSGETTTPPKL